MSPGRTNATQRLASAREALGSITTVAYDIKEELPEIESWLDSTTSAFSGLAQLKWEPESLEELLAQTRNLPEFRQLAIVSEEVSRLYEYASCVAYGVVSLGRADLRDAGRCFEEVHAALEAVLLAFQPQASANK